MRAVLVSVLLIVMTVGLACTNSTAQTALDPDAGTAEITIRRGQQHTLAIESNPSTGYCWAAEYDEESLTLVSEDYEQKKSDVVGAAGIQKFTFRGLTEGSTTITLHYARPWESRSPEKTIQVTCTIK